MPPASSANARARSAASVSPDMLCRIIAAQVWWKGCSCRSRLVESTPSAASAASSWFHRASLSWVSAPHLSHCNCRHEALGEVGEAGPSPQRGQRKARTSSACPPSHRRQPQTKPCCW
eukprot:scaffold26302_cov112-Isochrysis_galbana.AAC.8